MGRLPSRICTVRVLTLAEAHARRRDFVVCGRSQPGAEADR